LKRKGSGKRGATYVKSGLARTPRKNGEEKKKRLGLTCLRTEKDGGQRKKEKKLGGRGNTCELLDRAATKGGRYSGAVFRPKSSGMKRGSIHQKPL